MPVSLQTVSLPFVPLPFHYLLLFHWLIILAEQSIFCSCSSSSKKWLDMGIVTAKDSVTVTKTNNRNNKKQILILKEFKCLCNSKWYYSFFFLDWVSYLFIKIYLSHSIFYLIPTKISPKRFCNDFLPPTFFVLIREIY